MLKQEQKFVDFARKYVTKCDGKCQHISLLVIRNKILSVGQNSYRKTHPLSYYHGYKYCRTHSELLAIAKFPFRNNDINKATLINIRFARANSGLLLSKPCLSCQNLIAAFSIRQTIFSTPTGFEKL